MAKHTSQADTIIGKFGTAANMARLTGHPKTTIQYWKKVGFIPQDQHRPIIDVARAAGVEIGPEDFIAWLGGCGSGRDEMHGVPPVGV